MIIYDYIYMNGCESTKLKAQAQVDFHGSLVTWRDARVFSRQGGLKPQDSWGITVTNNYGKHTKNYMEIHHFY